MSEGKGLGGIIKGLESCTKDSPQGQPQTAVSAVYEEKKGEAFALLQQLKNMIDAHAAVQVGQPTNWAHVGDLAHVNVQLRQVRGFLVGDEYPNE